MSAAADTDFGVASAALQPRAPMLWSLLIAGLLITSAHMTAFGLAMLKPERRKNALGLA